MKHFFVLLIITLLFNSTTQAQYVNIPDDNFRSELQQKYPGCFNASNMLDTTCSEVVNAPLYQNNLMYIANWDGFQYFKNLQIADFTGGLTIPPTFPITLKKLSVMSASINSLPALPPGLIYLDCSETSLTSLPPLPNSLEHFSCSRTHISLPATLPASLKYFECSTVQPILALPILPNSLDTLICDNNSLTSLPTLPTALKRLNCRSNLLTALPSLPTQLNYIDFSANSVTVLPILPTGIQHVIFSSNQVSALPASLPADLRTLQFSQNNISSIPTLPSTLTILSCDNNQIFVLPTLPAGLQELYCSNNQISVIPTLPLTLEALYCGMNLLTSLPSLSPSLRFLYCGSNQLTSIPVLPQRLTYLGCSHNNVYYLPSLPDSLMQLDCQSNNITCMPVLPTPYPYAGQIYLMITMDNRINCIPNQPNIATLNVIDTLTLQTTSYYFSDPYPLCSAINNIHHCDAFPLITGYAYNDNNNNLFKDANEPYRANIKVELSNGAFTMTNSNGYYQIPADSIGNFSVTATAPNFFAAVPTQYNYNFNSYDTLVRGDFALQATTTVDSLTISVLPINWAARPGFAYPYLISYQNVGTTTLSPNIVFNYDNTRLNYDSSSNVAVTNSGSALSLAEPGFVAGMQKSYVAYFRVKPTAVIGDSIRSNVSLTANAIIATDSTITEIRGSFDPNDKSATAALSPSQVVNGNYIYYTIRFQNTGTDTAFNVVITDTLNSQLQAATLQVINTSHPAKVTVTGNAVSFEFLNILLPDSNVNELKSHGYVTFRIKPQTTVVLNDIIPNKAAIYFDYNSPVLTNTAVTNIMEPVSPVPLKLISFNVVRSTGNNGNAFWNTSNEINVQSYNIEMSIDGRTFSNISYEKAKGYQYNDYTKTISIPKNDILYFRLKMIDVDERFTYSPIVTLRNDQSQSFSFLNNPVKNELNISIQDDALKNTMAKIYNAQGLLVKTILLQRDVETLNVRSLPAGTYYLVTEKGSKQFIVVK